MLEDARHKIRSIDRKQDKVKEELVQMVKEMCVQFVYDYRSQENLYRYKSVEGLRRKNIALSSRGYRSYQI